MNAKTKILSISLLLLLNTYYILHTTNFIAYAQEKKENISLSPAYQEVEITQGQEAKEISFTISNNQKTASSFDIFPVNFAPKDLSGGVRLFEAKESSYLFSLASYISLGTEHVELAPYEKKEIGVVIQNRQDLSPGGHYAAIIVRQIGERSGTSVSPAISSLIYLKKTGGERFNLSLKEVTWPSSFIHFTYPSKTRILFQNEGNIHLVPYGTVYIKDMFGRTIYKGIINVNSFFVLPDSRRYIFVDFTKTSNSFPISFNRIEFSGSDSLHKVSYSYTDAFLYINLIFVAVLCGLIMLIFFIFKKIKKHK